MAKAYINIFGEVYEITDTKHQLERIAQRIGGNLDRNGFSVHRLETLLMNEDVADAIVNGEVTYDNAAEQTQLFEDSANGSGL